MAGYNLITPRHRSIRRYYENAAALRDQGVLNEMSVRSPFESLLQETARLKNWTFIAELSGKSGGALIRPDGTLRDRNSLPRGYWEAKDTQDDLDTEIKKKIARGYPLSKASASKLGEVVLSFRAWCSGCLASCLSASITGFNSTFMIALLLKKSSSRSQTAGNRPSSPGTFHPMMADDALHVCSELLTVSVSPIPSMSWSSDTALLAAIWGRTATAVGLFGSRTCSPEHLNT